MIYRLLKVALCEWKLFFKDPAAVLLLVAAGFFYAVYYPLPYLYQAAKKIPVGVVDLDQSSLSRQAIRMADAAEQIEIVRVFDNVDEAEKAFAEKEIEGFLQIPYAMESEIRKGNNVTLGIYAPGTYVMIYSNVATGFATSVGTLGAEIKIKRLAAKGYSVLQASAIRDALPLQFKNMYNGIGGYASYVVPGVLILVLQQTLIIGICILGGPRRSRRFKSLRGMNHFENEPLLIRYFGRSLSYILHYFLFFAFYHLVIYSLFDFPRRGEIFSMLVFIACFLGASVNLGMLISQLFRRRETGMQILLYCSIPFLFLSGFSWPRESMPEWIQAVSCLIPSTFAIPAWLSIEQMGASIAEVAKPLISLFSLSLFYLILALAVAKINENREGKDSLKSNSDESLNSVL